uniref:RdRp n=1 Tax=Wenling partiti-like virus 3 TaxID=1923521 RepID=A0A1L3KM02_9VIRU|nr:RdRp [Wenling partiti-like virus 3]
MRYGTSLPTRYATTDSKHWRSPVSLDGVREDVLSYHNTTVKPNCRHLDDAILAARRAFKIGERVNPIHLNDMLQTASFTDASSPGLPWRLYGYHTKKEVRSDERAVQSIRYFWHQIKCGKDINPADCCAYVRSHLTVYPKEKIRAVWGYPYTVSVQEACFAVPLIDAYKKRGPIAYGWEMVKGGMRKVEALLSQAHFKYALDFSSFDKTLPSWLIREAFDIIIANYDFSRYQDAGIPHTDALHRVWDYIVNYFINTPIRLSNGERFLKDSGVASGSYFTQIIDSVCNFILIEYICRKFGIYPSGIKVLGDDSIFCSNNYVSLDSMQPVFADLGMKLNVEKSIVTESLFDITFLGFRFENHLPVKPTEDWLAALHHPEHTDKSFDDFASRALGILYANCGVNLDVDQYCRAIIKSSPFRIKLSRSFRRYLRAMGVERLKKEPPPPTTLCLNILFG